MPYKEFCTCATRFMRPLTLSLAMALPGIDAAYADGDVRWDFRGFGSIAGAKTDTDDAEYRTYITQGEGATSDDIDWGLHSNLGAQLTADFGEQFSVTTQALAKRRGTDDMEADLEWLYASYRPASWFDLRAGRMVMPEFLISDYRSVGYAQPTIGPPAAAYMFGSITQFEGVQLINRIPIGNSVLSLQTSVGTAEEDFYNIGFGPDLKTEFEMEDLRGLSLTYEWDDLLLRAAELDAETELAGLGTIEMEFTAYGAQYDNGRLFATAEYIDRVNVAVIQYLTLGYRFGKWQPAVTVSDFELENFFGPNIEDDTTGFTLRYDMTERTAVKLQWEKMPSSNFYNWLTSDLMFFGSDEEREIVSFSLDFIF